MKHIAFLCRACSSALGDLLAFLVDGRGHAQVVAHDDDVLVVAEAAARRALVHRHLVVLVAGRETVDNLEGDGVVHHQVEPAGSFRRLPLDGLDVAERNLGLSLRHVFLRENFPPGRSQ